MFVLLPIVGGILAGRFAPRRTAIALQVLFYVVAVAGLTLGSPRHGGSYADVGIFLPSVAVVAAVTLWFGFWLAGRAAARTA